MHVRNRLADVKKLRTNICQDFLKLIIKPNWKKILYEKAKYIVENRKKGADKYNEFYNKMRNIGYENISIDDMDITIIFEIIMSCKDIREYIDKRTISCFKTIKGNKNIDSHSNDNENEKDLYLRGLLDLLNLEDFVKTVDKFETHIDENKRLKFRKNNICKIEKLKDILDEERIVLIQNEKQMINDINRILNSEDKLEAWIHIYDFYFKKAYKIEHDVNILDKFLLMASDMNVSLAHKYAADLYIIKMKDLKEGIKRIERHLYSDGIEKTKLSSAVDSLNTYLLHGGEKTVDFLNMINYIEKNGYMLTVNQHGLYKINGLKNN